MFLRGLGRFRFGGGGLLCGGRFVVRRAVCRFGGSIGRGFERSGQGQGDTGEQAVGIAAEFFRIGLDEDAHGLVGGHVVGTQLVGDDEQGFVRLYGVEPFSLLSVLRLPLFFGFGLGFAFQTRGFFLFGAGGFGQAFGFFFLFEGFFFQPRGFFLGGLVFFRLLGLILFFLPGFVLFGRVFFLLRRQRGFRFRARRVDDCGVLARLAFHAHLENDDRIFDGRSGTQADQRVVAGFADSGFQTAV